MPVARLSGVMSEGNHNDHLAVCYGHNGEKETFEE
jgi:hypothetical protein